MQFRLITLLNVFALLAAGMATFGVGCGIVACVVVLPLQRLPFAKWFLSKASPGPIEWLIILFAAVMVLGISAPLVSFVSDLRPQIRSSRTVCGSKLQELALSLINYHQVIGGFPHLGSDDLDSLSVSWRFSFLAITDIPENPLGYRYDEPSSSAMNQQFCRATPFYMTSCPSGKHEHPFASYFAVTGPETVWSDLYSSQLGSLPDGEEKAILLIEASDQGILWTEPRDIPLDKAVELLTTGKHPHQHMREGFFTREYTVVAGRNVAFADGHVENLPIISDPAIARALLTAAGGEEIPEDLSSYSLENRYVTEIKWRNVYGLSLFVALALLPALKNWRRSKAAEKPAGPYFH